MSTLKKVVLSDEMIVRSYRQAERTSIKNVTSNNNNVVLSVGSQACSWVCERVGIPSTNYVMVFHAEKHMPWNTEMVSN